MNQADVSPRPTAPVIVTGGTGFIGRRLLAHLQHEGYSHLVSFQRGTGVDRAALPPHDAASVTFVSGDVLSLEDLCRAIVPGSIVVHTAAMTHAGLSVQEPQSCFEINAMGTVRALEAARLAGAVGFIFVSTGLVYGFPSYLPVDERHPTAPLTPYAASKLAAEAAVLAYASNYGLPACVLRLSNVYGPGGHPDAVHSLILRQMLAGGPVELLDLASIRDFVHVDDVVQGIARIIRCLRRDVRVVLNLSAGEGHSIAAFASALTGAYCDAGGPGIDVRLRDAPRLSAVRELVFDNAAIMALTGWRPQYNLERGAAATVRELLTPAPVTP